MQPTSATLKGIAMFDDVLRLVLEELDPARPYPDYDFQCADALAKAARTNKTFNEYAIPVLWSCLPSAMPLLHLLPVHGVSALYLRPAYAK